MCVIIWPYLDCVRFVTESPGFFNESLLSLLDTMEGLGLYQHRNHYFCRKLPRFHEPSLGVPAVWSSHAEVRMQRTYRASFLLVCVVLLGGLARIAAQAPATAVGVPGASVVRRLDYNWDVRPILSDYCFRCHGPDEKGRQAGLRLDTPEGAFAALRRPGTFAIVPGKPAESQMIFRITHANAAVRMPPTVANKVLSTQQIEILRAWIAQAAVYKPHWASTAPQKVAIPTVPAAPSVLNEIDRFVQARLAREGLKLSPPADKETLINRVTLTLTG